MSERYEHWDREYRRPADDIRALRQDLATGEIDFAEFEMADR